MSEARVVLRRTGALLACAALLALPLASLAVGLSAVPTQRPLALGLALAGAGVALLNAWLAWVPPCVWRRLRGGARRRHVSGVPLLGNALVVVACGLGFGSAPCAALGLLALALDSGGVPWFVAATWRDASLWGR